MNIEEYFAERLRKEGVRRFFGIPGGPSIPYMEAFRKAGIEFNFWSRSRQPGFRYGRGIA